LSTFTWVNGGADAAEAGCTASNNAIKTPDMTRRFFIPLPPQKNQRAVWLVWIKRKTSTTITAISSHNPKLLV
jgi:hypothetical protein